MTARGPRKTARPPVVFASPTPAQVKEAREIVGVSQADAAAAAGVDGRQWARYEKGEVSMNGRMFINWCFRFDLVKPDL